MKEKKFLNYLLIAIYIIAECALTILAAFIFDKMMHTVNFDYANLIYFIGTIFLIILFLILLIRRGIKLIGGKK